MGNFTVFGGGVNTTAENLPNIDVRYGPYLSKNAAQSILAQDELICVGLTVGIVEGSNVVEYWWQGGTTLENLVPKNKSTLKWNE